MLFAQQIADSRSPVTSQGCRARLNLGRDDGRVGPARADAVDGDALGGRLQRHAFGQPHQPVLGGQVGRLVDRGHQAMHRGDVDDATPALRTHGGHGRAHRQEGRAEVDRQDGIPTLDREVLHRAGVLDTRVVDQNVRRPQCVASAGEQLACRFRVTQIGLHIGRLATSALRQLLRHRLPLSKGFNAVQHHIVAGLGQTSGNGQANALGGTGDQCAMPCVHAADPFMVCASIWRNSVLTTLP